MSVTNLLPVSESAAIPLTGKALQLSTGLRIWFRPIRPDDAQRLREFHRRLSHESQRLRFFSPMRELSTQMARRLTDVDFSDRVAFVACYQGEDDIRAVARYEVNADRASAELAFVVEDSIQGEGVGTALLHLLARQALQAGIRTLVATVLPENLAMLAMLESCEFPVERTCTGESIILRIDITGHEREQHRLRSA